MGFDELRCFSTGCWGDISGTFDSLTNTHGAFSGKKEQFFPLAFPIYSGITKAVFLEKFKFTFA